MNWLLLPQKLDVWLIVCYVMAVITAAHIIEMLAKWHFRRARQYAERGFEYVEEEDHYRCPEGKRLHLHQIHEEKRIAIYRADKNHCNACTKKLLCTPHDEGRHLYRSMAIWAETDVGRFHLVISMLIFGLSTFVAMIALVHWRHEPGAGLMGLCAVIASTAFLRTSKEQFRSRSISGEGVA